MVKKYSRTFEILHTTQSSLRKTISFNNLMMVVVMMNKMLTTEKDNKGN